MLTPEYLEKAPQKMLELSHRLEDFLIRDIARRISTSIGQAATQSALYQLNAAERFGLNADHIQAEVAKLTQKGEAEIMVLFDDAAREGLKYGNDLIAQAGDAADALNESVFWSVTDAIKKQSLDQWNNITRSLGFADVVGGKMMFKPIAQFYQDTLDFALYQIQSGTLDYNTAIRQAVKKLADSGLRTVDYATGWSNRIDVAARRAVMTGVTQLSGHLADQTASILDTTLMEITAHPGARPSHVTWQGRIVDRSGRDTRYLTLDAIGYGSGDGFKGWNCRHDWFPFVEGVSVRKYTEKQLREIDPPLFTYRGKTYTAYEATQQQRKLETAIRRTKRELIGYDASEDEDAFTTAAAKLRQQRIAYSAFSKAAKLPEQPARTQEYGFGRTLAGKSK